MSNGKTKLVIVGGFLGAGKTTAIARLAGMLIEKGLRIGIVTNDQGSDLVDTAFLAREGLSVLEVTGGCFCCNFEELIDRLFELASAEQPDIILAEPVGSCTDLVATIFRPIQEKLTSVFTLRPLTVLADPRRVSKLLEQVEGTAIPTEVSYLFEKQLEEADIIALNKVDTLEPAGAARLAAFLRSRFPGREVRLISAREGTGIAGWAANLMDRAEAAGLRLLEDIDYDRYGAAEAALGWLNYRASIRGDAPCNFAEVATAVVTEAAKGIGAAGGEIAHLKVYAVADEGYAKVSLVEPGGEPRLEQEMTGEAPEALLLINVRAAIEPDALRAIVDAALDRAASRLSLTTVHIKSESFRPGFPRPTFRYTPA